MLDIDLTEADRAQLSLRGIPLEEAGRQIALLRRPKARDLARACTVGDGIARIPDGEMPELVHIHQETARAGRVLKFVPASGAASRMFRDLMAFREANAPLSRQEIDLRAQAGDPGAIVLARFLGEIQRFAFFGELSDTLSKRGFDIDRLLTGGGVHEVLAALLDPDGMGYARMPKGLVKFHRDKSEVRTAFEEHLVEAAALARAGDGTCRLHLTVSAEEGGRFQAHLERVRSRHERKRKSRFVVEFSVQKPSTDTLSLDGEGRVFRDAEGSLLLRPGGHGSLLVNLNDLGADIVHVKNIDNVAKEELAARGVLWKRLLVGFLVRLQREIADHARRLERGDPSSAERARDFSRRRLLLDVPGDGLTSGEDEARTLLALLRRPLRVCGVVQNAGEPGGAPFWVRGKDGRLSLQIVEGAEVDQESESQRGIFSSSTHFNPVDLVCGVRDDTGRPFDLREHLDPEAVFLTRKSSLGRDLLALERPGLWNGAMSDWNTVFVEIPGTTFTPVKTVLDLLREEHQGAVE